MDLRSKLGYSKNSPWEFASENLINSPDGTITMKNTIKPLKAFDAKTGKFLTVMQPGNNYKFNTNKIIEKPLYQFGGVNSLNSDDFSKKKKRKGLQDNLTRNYQFSGVVDENGKWIDNPTYEKAIKVMADFMKNNWDTNAPNPSNNYLPEWQHHSFDPTIPLPTSNYAKLGGYYQSGGPINECPPGFVKDETGQCVQDNGFNPSQLSQKGMPIIPTTNTNGNVVGGTGAIEKSPETNLNQTTTKTTRGFSPSWFRGISALNFGLSAFSNSVEEGRQAAWNQKQMNNPLFNGSYSFAQNDYGVDPYEQTGQLKQFQSGGRKPITVTNPNDPRLKAYSDSLTLYNAYADKPLDKWLKNVPKTKEGYVSEAEWDKVSGGNNKNAKNEWAAFDRLKKLNKTEPGTKFPFKQALGNTSFDTYVRTFKKPVQPVVYQKPQQIMKAPPTGTNYYGDNGQGIKKAEFTLQPNPKGYDKKYPPIYLTNAKDPRIGQYHEKGNQYLYQKPKPIEYPIHKLQPAVIGKANITSPQAVQISDPVGQPVYGPSNGLIGYQTDKGFQPTLRRDHLAKANQADIDLLNNPEELLKYSTTKPRYQQGGKFNAYDFLYGDDEKEQKSEEAPKQEKRKTRITEENVDQLSMLGLSPEDIVNSVNSYKNYQNKNRNIDYNSVSNVSSTEAINKVKNYYSSQGYDKSFIAGVLGNIHAESNGNPNAQEAGGSGFGLFQHTGPRKKQLFNWAKQNGYDPSDPITQAKFAETESSFQKAYKQSVGKTAGKAASIFENIFEKPGIKRSKVRVGAANSFYNSFKEGGSYVVDFATLRDLQTRGIKFKLL